MQGHPEVIVYLTKQLRGELAARDQYFLHSRRYQDLGLSKLHARSDHEMQEETQHADALLQRLLMLRSKRTQHGFHSMDPDMCRLAAVRIRTLLSARSSRSRIGSPRLRHRDRRRWFGRQPCRIRWCRREP